QRKEIEKKYLLPALEHIQKSSGGGSGAPAAAEAPAVAQALIAFYEKRYEDAAKLAHEVAEKSPWLDEASKIEGDAYFTLGTEKQEKGDDEGAQREYERSGEAYQKASDVARSDGDLHEAVAEVWISVMTLQISRGKDPTSAFEKAISFCD